VTKKAPFVTKTENRRQTFERRKIGCYSTGAHDEEVLDKQYQHVHARVPSGWKENASWMMFRSSRSYSRRRWDNKVGYMHQANEEHAFSSANSIKPSQQTDISRQYIALVQSSTWWRSSNRVGPFRLIPSGHVSIRRAVWDVSSLLCCTTSKIATWCIFEKKSVFFTYFRVWLYLVPGNKCHFVCRSKTSLFKGKTNLPVSFTPPPNSFTLGHLW
jgi:hypothetical protein